MGKYTTHAYKTGYRDGKNGTYRPPHDALLDHAFGVSEKAKRRRTEYKQGYRHGRGKRRG